jgi:hypothetical protein
MLEIMTSSSPYRMATPDIVNSRQIFRMIRQFPAGFSDPDVPVYSPQKVFSGTTLQQTAFFFKKTARWFNAGGNLFIRYEINAVIRKSAGRLPAPSLLFLKADVSGSIFR